MARRAALLLVLAAVLASSMGMGLARLALARYMRYSLALPAVVVSSFTTWFMAARAFSASFTGFMAARSPRLGRLQMWTPILAVSALVYFVSTASSAAAILAAAAVWGFLSGLAWPLVQTFTALVAGGRSSTAMSLYFASGSLGTIAGQYLYGVLGLPDRAIVGLSSQFFLASSLLLAAASELGRVEFAERPRRGSSGGLRLLLGGLSFRELWILLSAFASGFLGGTLRELLYIYLGEVYGMGRSELASTLAGGGLLSIAASLAVGPLADRYGVVPVLRGVLLMGAAGALLLATPLSPLLALAGLSLALASTRSSLPLTRNAAVFTPGRRAGLVGLSNTLSNMGQMISPVVGGWMYDRLSGRSLGPVPGSATVYLLSALLLLAVALWPVRVEGRASGDSSPAR